MSYTCCNINRFRSGTNYSNNKSGEIVLNIYKEKRNLFLNKYFSYPEELEKKPLGTPPQKNIGIQCLQSGYI